MTDNRLVVRHISASEHAAWIETQSSVSFLQTPEWAQVKREWRAVSIGWFAADDSMVGAGLVLLRDAPVIKRSLAYLPEGPSISWHDGPVDRWLNPLVEFLKSQRAFTVKIGVPVEIRRWSADDIKAGLETAQRLNDITPTVEQFDAVALKSALRTAGWVQENTSEGFGDLQPRFVYTVDVANKSDEQLSADLNQLWRRNIKKAEKAGVVVRVGTREDLQAFHAVYVETAERDHFRPRPVEYFERYWDAFASSGDRMRLYLAEINGEVAAATIWIRVGARAWYSYGASTTAHRDYRPSNAIQWRMLRDARDAGAEVYDLRGISDTLDESHPLFGLIRFKLGIGGQAVEYVGEHDFAINPLLNSLFKLYLKRR